MTESCICPRATVPFWHNDDRVCIAGDCPVHGLWWNRAPLWFFPFGIRDVVPYGCGRNVLMQCGCQVFYVSGKVRAAAGCDEHVNQRDLGRSIVVGHTAHCN